MRNLPAVLAAIAPSLPLFVIPYRIYRTGIDPILFLAGVLCALMAAAVIELGATWLLLLELPVAGGTAWWGLRQKLRWSP